MEHRVDIALHTWVKYWFDSAWGLSPSLTSGKKKKKHKCMGNPELIGGIRRCQQWRKKKITEGVRAERNSLGKLLAI